MTCEKLYSLRISSKNINRKLNSNICLALPHAKSLLQFRFDVLEDLPVDEIMKSLPRKLQRVFLKSYIANVPSEKLLYSVLNDRDQLKFLGIVLRSWPKTTLEQICSNLCARLKNSNKVIVMDNNEYFTEPIPSVYMHENVRFESQVSTFDLFNFDWE